MRLPPQPRRRRQNQDRQRHVNRTQREQRRGRFCRCPCGMPCPDRRAPLPARTGPGRARSRRTRPPAPASARASSFRIRAPVPPPACAARRGKSWRPPSRNSPAPRASHRQHDRGRHGGPRRWPLARHRIEESEIDQPFTDKPIERRQTRHGDAIQARTTPPSTASRATVRPAGSSPACPWRAAPNPRRRTAAP